MRLFVTVLGRPLDWWEPQHIYGGNGYDVCGIDRSDKVAGCEDRY